MTITELKDQLEACDPRSMEIRLPDGRLVPPHFHVTEVGFVKKTFIDCGGEVRVDGKCVLQIWVANDTEHRVSSKTLSKILDHGKPVIPTGRLPIEIEYNDPGLTLMPLERVEITEDSLTLCLSHRRTDCLAKDVCGITAENDCVPGGGCC